MEVRHRRFRAIIPSDLAVSFTQHSPKYVLSISGPNFPNGNVLVFCDFLEKYLPKSISSMKKRENGFDEKIRKTRSTSVWIGHD